MKKKTIQLLVIILMATGTIIAQDIRQSDVPSVVVNNFKKEFPKAKDVEWEMKGDVYNVEFEIGIFTDYEAWFDTSGNLIKYTQEIPNRELPKAIKDAVKKQFDGYRVDDVKKQVENNIETYLVEIEKKKEELNLVFSKDGKLHTNKK